MGRVYPELVTRDERGTVEGVRYDELAPLLLNELQQQQRIILHQQERSARLEQHLSAQDRMLRQMHWQLASIETGSIHSEGPGH